MRSTRPSRFRPLARKTIAAAASMILVLGASACGSDDESTATTGVPAATDASGSTADSSSPTTAATAETASAESAPASTQDTTAPTEATTASTEAETTTTVNTEPHTVVHAMGETEVIADPQRVVVLDSSFLDAAIALGVTPIGAPEGVAGRGLPAYLGDDLAGIEIVGETTSPNLELIASLQPDLIIGAKVRHEALYETLSQIAPTVMSESSGTNWTDQVRLTADALGRQDAAEALLAEFEARAVQVGTDIGATGKTAAIVRFIPGQTRLYGPETFSGSVLTLVGFDLGTNEAKGYDPAFSMALISEEQIDLIDSDVIFTTTLADGGSARPAFEALWNTLPAVQNGMRFDIQDDVWMTGIGVIGANLILDDLEAFLG